jgi:endonuclease III related protein
MMIQNNVKIYPIQLYTILFNAFGPQQWWPMDHTHHHQFNTDPRFEVMIGAILTQNTAWTNVEKAIHQLKQQNLLNINQLALADSLLVKQMIKPSGYFNQKTKRLQTLAQYLKEYYNSDLNSFFTQSLPILRKELLSLHGIGPETADSIVLYAAEKPIFVVDAYTKRLCTRIPLPINSQSYDDIQKFFQDHLSTHYSNHELVQIYNEFHALIVNLGKYYCKPKPNCAHCPVLNHCQFGKKNGKIS